MVFDERTFTPGTETVDLSPERKAAVITWAQNLIYDLSGMPVFDEPWILNGLPANLHFIDNVDDEQIVFEGDTIRIDLPMKIKIINEDEEDTVDAAYLPCRINLNTKKMQVGRYFIDQEGSQHNGLLNSKLTEAQNYLQQEYTTYAQRGEV